MGVEDQPSLLMKWDNGRGLNLLPFDDDFTVIGQEMDVETGQQEQSL